MTPFQALYGYEHPKWREITQGDAKVPTVKSQLEENQRVMQVLKDNLTGTKLYETTSRST